MVREVFEFLDCASLNISYAQNGLATISFTVVSTEILPGVTPPRDFTQHTFGGIDFKGFVTGLSSAPILGSIPTVFEHRFSIMGTGCSSDCPRGTTP